MLITCYKQGLKAACDALFIPLADMRTEFNSDGEEVHYGEDDNPLSKNPPSLPHTQPEIDPFRSPSNNDIVSSAPPSPTVSITNSNGVGK